MEKQLAQRIVAELRGSKVGAIIACALGEDRDVLPRFTGKAVVTSDGFMQANFVDADGISRHSAFVGSYGELEQNLISVGNFLRTLLGLSEEQVKELREAVLDGWIAIDYR